MSEAPCIPLHFRRANAGERVVAFEDTRGKESWEVAEMRSATPPTACRGSWIGAFIEDRGNTRRMSQRRNRIGSAAETPATAVPLDEHRQPSERLLAAWAPVDARLRAAIDESTYNIWIAPLHPHAFVGGVWRVGCDPRYVGWVTARFGRVLAACAQSQIAMVGCSDG